MAVSTRVAKKPAKKMQVPRSKLPKVEEELKGLCVTCGNADGCIFRKRNKQPVLFCEEFDSGVPTIVEQVSAEPYPTIDDMREWDKYKGLCVNCENRENCAIRDREIGVWHCEEYR
jgi:hypothetical protein